MLRMLAVCRSSETFQVIRKHPNRESGRMNFHTMRCGKVELSESPSIVA